MTLYRTRRRLVEAFQFCPQPLNVQATVGGLAVCGLTARVVLRAQPGALALPIMVVPVAVSDAETVELEARPHDWIVITGDDAVVVYPDDVFRIEFEQEEIDHDHESH